GMSALIITHDLGLAWNIADTVAVMKEGEIVEYGEVDSVLENPQHAYTQELLAAVPQLGSQSLVSNDYYPQPPERQRPGHPSACQPSAHEPVPRDRAAAARGHRPPLRAFGTERRGIAGTGHRAARIMGPHRRTG